MRYQAFDFSQIRSARWLVKADEGLQTESKTSLGADDLFEMANLFPGTTGLPMTVWVGPRGNSRHDVRVKVDMLHGNHMDPSNTAVVGLRPTPHIITGTLSQDDENAVYQWISLNIALLLDYWEGAIGPSQLVRGLKGLPAA